MKEMLLDCKYTYMDDPSTNGQGLSVENLDKALIDSSSLFVAHMPDGEIDIAIPYQDLCLANGSRNYSGRIFFKKYHLVHCNLDAISDAIAYELGRDFPPITTFRGVEPIAKFASTSKDLSLDENVSVKDISAICREYNKKNKCSYM